MLPASKVNHNTSPLYLTTKQASPTVHHKNKCTREMAKLELLSGVLG